MANAAGWAKISKIVPEVMTQPVDVWEKDDGTVEVIEEVCFEIVWIEAEGCLFEVTLLKGETLDAVAARYRVGGYTDGRCTFVRAL